jgi:hypothetical protein
MLPSTVLGRWEIPPLLDSIAAVLLRRCSWEHRRGAVARAPPPPAPRRDLIPANALAWIAGLPFTVAPPMLLPDDSTTAAFVVVGPRAAY